MVEKVSFADNANEEIDAVGKIDLRHEAVADKKFKQQLTLTPQQATPDSTTVITLTKYEPNQLTYDVKSKAGGVVVFSEIYYPGWTATVDDQPVELARVDYILRALTIKGGSHKVVLSFFPKSVDTTETIAYAASALLLLAIVAAAVAAWRRNKKEK